MAKSLEVGQSTTHADTKLTRLEVELGAAPVAALGVVLDLVWESC
jgi:hypothetical protein